MAMLSCNALKRVKDDQLLLNKNKVIADDKKISNGAVQSLILQKPNSTILGYPLRLNLYNLAKPNPDSSFQDWLQRKEKREKRLNKLLSKKQVNRLGESFIVKGFSEWLKRIGEPPVIVDSVKSTKSLARLKAYYRSKGYFNVQGAFAVDSSSRKQRADVTYDLQLGNPYIIDTISENIQSSAIDSIYQLHKIDSYVKEGHQFNSSNFNKERERLIQLFRNSGIYNFQESSIRYTIEQDTVNTDDQMLNATLNINNLKKRTGDSLTGSEYKVHRFDHINIYTDYEFDTDKNTLQSVDYENYRIYFKDKLNYIPRALTDAVFLEKDSVYTDLDRIRTRRQITNLNTFRYPNIEFIEDSTRTKLTTNIYLSPLKKNSLGVNFEFTRSTIQRLGVVLGASFLKRNIFKGAETLTISGRGSFGLLSDTSLPEDFFSEIGGDINLSFPRIWFPLLNTRKIIPFYMLPKTNVSMGISFQQNIGLDKQTFNTVFGYDWTPSDRVKNTLELLNIQFVRNVNSERFFNVYQNSFEQLDAIADDFQDDPALAEFFNDDPDPQLIIPNGTTGFTNAVLNEGLIPNGDEDFNTVRNINERQIRLTENNLIFASNYSFSKNNKSNPNDASFSQYQIRLESAGNLLSGISRIIPFEENNGDRLIFGVPYSQYIKTDLDYIKHWDLSKSKVLAFRSFLGLAVPYGNSDNIPFARSYFAGGANDNRAWFPYSLGPGRTQNINDFNEANLKIALNLEYRFPLAGDLKGALFADAGNIWNVFDNVDDPDATFNGISSLADIALGTGFGLRYDLTYFVFRVDVGFKTYNPAEEPSQRWFRQFNFANAIPQIGINYPF
ncbi:translocation and assembly module lipoprotein TamL [Spongiimicrobium salis]|uniref:translocation and assembly module lipoprotein TamL n=1 Tax=Spongiimicrobium salis TaxID=1667022 RepID=UPI00374D918C